MITWMYDSATPTIGYNTFTNGTWDTAGDIPILSGAVDNTNKGAGLILTTDWSEEHSSIGIVAATGADKSMEVNVWDGSAWDTAVEVNVGAQDMDPSKGASWEAVRPSGASATLTISSRSTAS